jgi:glucokinase
MLGRVPTLVSRATGGDSEISAKDVIEAMNQGDPYAIDIIDRAMHYLGIGMANLVNLFNPERLVIGGGLANLGDRLLDPVRRAIALHAFPSASKQLTVMLAKLGTEVGIVGAAGSAVMAIQDS